MPKANKPNAYLFFMIDWKKKQEKMGRSFPNGLKDVQSDPQCSDTWKKLSDQEKAYYKSMERNSKSNRLAPKRTGLGEKLSDIERAQMKQQEFNDNMIEYITSVVNDGKECNGLDKLDFYVIHINFYYSRIIENNETEYYPAEIAIVEFSLGKGVKRVYHEIINERIKIGFASAAKDHSANTHNIPPNAPFGKSDYLVIFQDIYKFLEPGKKNGKLPPVYTMSSIDEVHYPVKSVLGKLASAAQKPEDYILVYSLEELFSCLHTAVTEQMQCTKIEPIVAKIELKKDRFNYKTGLECDFHGDLKIGMNHCSQSYAKRWIFIICSYCCKPLNITMISGFHIPKENIETSHNMVCLNSSFSTLSLNESRQGSSVLSMTGVSNDYRQRVSERTAREEQRRRADAENKPITIIDHSVLNAKKVQEPIERPLRAPHTKSAVTYLDTTDTESLDLSELSFPCMGSYFNTVTGRGKAVQKRRQNQTSGQGYADCLKK